MLRHPRFYTAFFQDCDVTAEGLDLGIVSLDPILNPGDRQVRASITSNTHGCTRKKMTCSDNQLTSIMTCQSEFVPLQHIYPQAEPDQVF